MLRLLMLALFGWVAYRIVEENRSETILLPPPDDYDDEFDDEFDGDEEIDGDEEVRPGRSGA